MKNPIDHDDDGHRFSPLCEECLDSHEHVKCLCCPTTIYLPKGATEGTNGAICGRCRDYNSPQGKSVWESVWKKQATR